MIPQQPQQVQTTSLDQFVESTQRAVRQTPPALLAKLQAKTANTRDMNNSKQWLRAMLYGDTDARKTTTAAHFGTPESTRIIMIRQREQLIPLRSEGYEYFLADNAAEVENAAMHCDSLWPDWAKHPDRLLILDDVTAFKDFEMEAGSVSDSGREVKDVRRMVKTAKDAINEVIRDLMSRPMNLIVIATQRTNFNEIEGTERILPDLPPSIGSMLRTAFEQVWYIDKEHNYQLITSSTQTVFTGKDPSTGKDKTFRRIVFAKNKQDLQAAQAGVLLQRENLDLRAAWNKILQGKAQAQVPAALSTKAVVNRAIQTVKRPTFVPIRRAVK